MQHKVIKSEKDYRIALARIAEVRNAKKHSPDGDELELLTLLIDKYETEKYVMPLPDPIQAIKFRMDQLGYRQRDLEPIIGHKSHVSEVLNKKRKLSLEMIRKLHVALNIPAEVLIQEYPMAGETDLG